MYRKSFPKLTGLAVAAIFAVSALIPQIANAAPKGSSAPTALVQGLVTSGQNPPGSAGTFSGVLKITGFAVQNGQLVANGVLNGTILNPGGTTTTPVVNQAVTAVVNSATGSCSILSLTLGPLNVDLLGLVITLNEVHLNIVAVPGAGNLLGNLLCDVAGLLNSGGALSAIEADLNNILGILGAL